MYDITDNIFSTYYKSFEPGEYHIFMYYNADKSEVSDYNYTLSTYSEEKVELIDFEDNNEIPYNYLFQVVHCYISQRRKARLACISHKQSRFCQRNYPLLNLETRWII